MRRLAIFLAFWMAAFARGPVLNLVVEEGAGQINNIRQRTAREPVVQVEDENHKACGGRDGRVHDAVQRSERGVPKRVAHTGHDG